MRRAARGALPRRAAAARGAAADAKTGQMGPGGASPSDEKAVTARLLCQARADVGIPPFGLGTWLSPPGKAGEAARHALQKAGYVHFDCAAVYGNEPEIGDLAFSHIRPGERERLWITSKLWLTEMRGADVRAACEKSLKELRLDYLDLYMIHWPVPLAKDAPGGGSSAKAAKMGITSLRPQDFLEPDLSATWREMEKLVDAGLVRHLGLCNTSQPKLQTLLDSGISRKPAVMQMELHPHLQQPGLLRFCGEHGIAVTAYSSMGSPGSMVHYNKADTVQVAPLEDPEVCAIAGAHGKEPAQVLLRWALQRGTVAIPKSVTPSRIESNADLIDWELTAAEMGRINDLDQHRRYLGHLGTFYCRPGETLAEFWGEKA